MMQQQPIKPIHNQQKSQTQIETNQNHYSQPIMASVNGNNNTMNGNLINKINNNITTTSITTQQQQQNGCLPNGGTVDRHQQFHRVNNNFNNSYNQKHHAHTLGHKNGYILNDHIGNGNNNIGLINGVSHHHSDDDNGSINANYIHNNSHYSLPLDHDLPPPTPTPTPPPPALPMRNGALPNGNSTTGRRAINQRHYH
ncbi:GATA zinc finger domain-containing protein 15-like [Condylostylus longicornis]|uniref:GATA zinc finger domain-containing protein 15-like n=1 Tax=Condylostylus longicornis TaxID=2530218 RepID=UPI00244DBFB8|nr:GATA zinc finger domain-containing protein 15-like [Condylostylus longicornis]XP_055390322.1 GATA zinc finger domain-containing protein 15-like [Condylostylus longicornis]